MSYEKITIKDIARALQLSASTISRSLRGSYEISEKTKKRVAEYAEKVNFRPNPVALRLKEGKTRMIGVVVSEIANTFFSEAINGIESVAYSRGYHVMIAQSHESGEREKANVTNLVSHSADGLLLSLSSGTKDESYLKDLYNKRVPIVFFDRVSNEINTYKVTADNYKGAFDATDHLIRQGFKKIAHITSAPFLSITKERLQGYKDALLKHNIPFDQTLVKNCNNGGKVAKEVEDALNELFDHKDKPDAIFTASDRITVVCFDLIQQKKSEQKIGYAGFSNSKVGHLFHPSLTVVQQPAFEIGHQATELLIKMIESKRPITDFEMKVLDTRLIKRESSKKEIDGV